MDTRRFFLNPISAALLVLLLAVSPCLGAQQQSALDLTIKISRLDQLLDRIDAMAAETRPEAGQPPSTMLRAMLQGTDWIDPQRPIVVGVQMAGDRSVAAALVPFLRPNENFASRFNARAAGSHYVVSLPPGQPLALSQAGLASLAAASSAPAESAITVEVAAGQLLEKAGPKIREKIDFMQIPPQQASMGPGITNADLRSMFEGFIDLGRQAESVTVGIDLYAEQFRILTETRAAAGSQMAALFSSGSATARLGGFPSNHQIRMRSRGYDLEGAVNLFAEVFGPLYRGMGIDFSGITEIAGHFTGEAAGGISYGPDGVDFEMIAVLKDKAAGTDFLSEVYLPWMETYSRLLSAAVAEQFGAPAPEIYRRTGDSTVAGHRVAGGIHRQPIAAAGEGPAPVITTEVRIAQVKDLLLFAPNDERMAALIQTAGAMTPGADPGPNLRVDVDLAAYMKGLLSLMPEMGQTRLDLPEKARMGMTLVLSGGKAVARTTIDTAGFAEMIAAAQAAQQQSATALRGVKGPAVLKTDAVHPVLALQGPALPPEKDPDYWYEKGALAATYGADRYAVQYFEKVLALDPTRSDAWFEMGVSYGELRWFDKAVEAIDRAIGMRPDSGLYYYGRGRIYLMLGADGQAMADFERAAELGNEDAREYLQRPRP